jgi:hypothetical protein
LNIEKSNNLIQSSVVQFHNERINIEDDAATEETADNTVDDHNYNTTRKFSGNDCGDVRKPTRTKGELD